MRQEIIKNCKVELMNYSLVQISVTYTFSNFCFVLCIVVFLPKEENQVLGEEK